MEAAIAIVVVVMVEAAKQIYAADVMPTRRARRQYAPVPGSTMGRSPG